MKRISGRACERCRSRKSKCDLDSSGTPGTPPCERCINDGTECILASSNRGGRRVRKHVNRSNLTSQPSRYSLSANGHFGTQNTGLEDAYPISSVARTTEQNGGVEVDGHEGEEPPTIESTIASTSLHNTTDTLNFLSHTLSPQASGLPPHVPAEAPTSAPLLSSVTISYPLVSNGHLSTAQVANLITRFAENYHQYLPLAPRRNLDPKNLPEVVAQEPHLVTAMITIAAKDLPNPDILQVCSRHMQELVAELAAGKKCDVEAVEALLLLAEWEPQGLVSDVKEVGCGEEDRAAWMHVGLALRIGYWLRLDRTSFRDDDEDKLLHSHRRRLAWACCYISDRLICVRIGRAFWSRGPGPMTALRSHDFPSLEPQAPGDDDYASILQATLALTQLFTNVHEVLYSGMGSSFRMMLVGPYVKYVDDFRQAISNWKSVWGTLTCSLNLKATLQMSYEYLRLYTNAYAFQATTSRAISSKIRNNQGRSKVSFGDVASLPDARFIYESVDASKSLLTIFNNYVDPEKGLKHLPLRFFLYSVNATIFLYKAWSLNIMNTEEKAGVRRMIQTTISRLRKASNCANDFGSRYAQLLELLWQRADLEVTQNTSSEVYPSLSSHRHQQSGRPPTITPSIASRQPQPQLTQPDLFSWLDLQAVGDAVTADQTQIQNQPQVRLGVDGIQQLLDGATRRVSMAPNGNGNAGVGGVFGENSLGDDVGAGVAGGGDSSLAWLFEDDLVWPDDEYSNLIF